jgi:hypothetical protein
VLENRVLRRKVNLREMKNQEAGENSIISFITCTFHHILL